eukprot:COSAG06_NODE_2497_length_6757_cov_80.480625_7_plen_188_part_00
MPPAAAASAATVASTGSALPAETIHPRQLIVLSGEHAHQQLVVVSSGGFFSHLRISPWRPSPQRSRRKGGWRCTARRRTRACRAPARQQRTISFNRSEFLVLQQYVCPEPVLAKSSTVPQCKNIENSVVRKVSSPYPSHVRRLLALRKTQTLVSNTCLKFTPFGRERRNVVFLFLSAFPKAVPSLSW